jgi:hypothetical protein
MHDKQLDALTGQIVRIASSADLGPPTPTRRERNLSHQGVAFSLGAGVSEEYDDLVRKCLNHADWGEKFSENYVEKSLRAILAEAMVNRESPAEARKKASKGLTSLVARLDEYAVEHTCYVPLAGLRLSSGDVELGQVVLEELTEERVNQLVGTVTTILNASKHTEDEKQALIRSEIHIIQGMQGWVCAKFRAVAEPERARDRAETEARRVLDLLRFAVPMLYPPWVNVAVGFDGEVFATQRMTPTLSDVNFNLQMVRVGPLSDLDLSQAKQEVMREVGAFDISDILRKPSGDLNDFEEALLRGVHWFADSRIQQEPENQLLSLITCLEAFLTQQGGSPIRSTVAEGVAMILGEGLEQRRELKKLVIGVYGQRSAVSHGGRTAVLQADLGQLEYIAHMLIRALIQRRGEFANRQGLARWLEDQRLA